MTIKLNLIIEIKLNLSIEKENVPLPLILNLAPSRRVGGQFKSKEAGSAIRNTPTKINK